MNTKHGVNEEHRHRTLQLGSTESTNTHGIKRPPILECHDLAVLGTFIMISRIAVKVAGLSGLVKKSAQLLAVETSGTLISKASTISRM